MNIPESTQLQKHPKLLCIPPIKKGMKNYSVPFIFTDWASEAALVVVPQGVLILVGRSSG